MNWRDHYDGLARKHGNSFKAAGWWSQGYFRAVQHAVLQIIDPGMTHQIIDIGCGPGLLLKPYIPPFRIIGLDYSGEMLKLALRNSLVPVCGDYRMIPVKSGSMHSVICTGVLQTIENPVPVIGELTRITHPDGQIIVVTHNSQSVIRKIAPRKGFSNLPDRDQVENAFLENGFTPAEMLGIHYPRLKPVKITGHTFFHRYFCTTLIWKFRCCAGSPMDMDVE